MERWEGVLEGPPKDPFCSQYSIFVKDPEKRVFGEEDCLYLSVFTPSVRPRLTKHAFQVHSELRETDFCLVFSIT